MYHTDVVAFVKKGTEPRIGVISDNVDPDLTEFMRRVIKEYGEPSLLAASGPERALMFL